MGLNPSSQRELLQFLYDQAKRSGHVTDDFLERLLQREEKFPTGLELPGYNVSIPHTDAECVKKEFIAIATLNTPIPFYLMEDKGKQADVSLVFMLGLKNPHDQLEVLKELIGLIQDKDKVAQLVSASSKDDVFQTLHTASIRK